VSRFTLGVLLVAMWVLLWDTVTLANVVVGALVVVLLYLVFPSERVVRPQARFHPIALGRLILYMAWQMVVSNVLLAREIVSPRSRVRSSIIEVPMRTSSRSMIALVGNLLALTPGTMTVAASADPPMLRLHVMLLHESDEIVASVGVLERRCVCALGSDQVIDEFERAASEGEGS
jgi:multisubunit Na+/H+ antiporter MnhE subunit